MTVLWLLVIIPLILGLSAFALSLAGQSKALMPLALADGAIAVLLCLWMLIVPDQSSALPWFGGLSLGLAANPLSAVLGLVAAAGILASARSARENAPAQILIHGILLGVFFVLFAASLLEVVLGWGIVTGVTYALLVRERPTDSRRALLGGKSADWLLFLGTAAAFGALETLSFTEIPSRIPQAPGASALALTLLLTGSLARGFIAPIQIWATGSAHPLGALGMLPPAAAALALAIRLLQTFAMVPQLILALVAVAILLATWALAGAMALRVHEGVVIVSRLVNRLESLLGSAFSAIGLLIIVAAEGLRLTQTGRVQTSLWYGVAFLVVMGVWFALGLSQQVRALMGG